MTYKFRKLFVLLIIWTIKFLAVDALPKANIMASPTSGTVPLQEGPGKQGGPGQQEGFGSPGGPEQLAKFEKPGGSSQPGGPPLRDETKEQKPGGVQPGGFEENQKYQSDIRGPMQASQPTNEYPSQNSNGVAPGASAQNGNELGNEPKPWETNTPNGGSLARPGGGKPPGLSKRPRPKTPCSSGPQKSGNPTNMFSHFYGYFSWCAEFYKWVEKYGKWMSHGVNCMFH